MCIELKESLLDLIIFNKITECQQVDKTIYNKKIRFIGSVAYEDSTVIGDIIDITWNQGVISVTIKCHGGYLYPPGTIMTLQSSLTTALLLHLEECYTDLIKLKEGSKIDIKHLHRQY